MADRVFRSKRDGWLVIVLGGVIVALLLAAVPLLQKAFTGFLPAIPGLLLLTGSLALSASVMGVTRYIVSGDELFIRSGPFRWTVPIGSIESVSATDDPSSAPALSLERLKIEYVRDGSNQEILVSPENQQDFVETLRARNPKIR